MSPATACVALLAEGVGRNPAHLLLLLGSVLVALLAEGVGRNNDGLYQYPTPDLVALLAEGVGRNTVSFEGPFVTFSRPPRGGRG